MSSGDTPFGFSSGNADGEDRRRPDDDLASKIPLFAEIEKLMSWHGGPVNWDLARQIAIKTASDGDRAVTAADRSAAADALRLADLWLEDATTLPSGLGGEPLAWTRVQWVEQTLPVWRSLIDTVAERVSAAVGGSLQDGLRDMAENGLPPELAGMLPAELASQLPQDAAGFQAMLGPMMGMVGQVGGLLFGSQVGQALGALAGDVLTAGEVGLPLVPAGVTALVPANIDAFGADLAVPADEVRLFLALREAAGARLFAHVPWLRAGLLGAVEEYARGIRVDPEQIQRSVQSMQGLDMSDPESINRAFGEGLFESADSPEQVRALARLETLLALVEGWVDVVTAAASGPRLPQAAALQETMRRRRAAGGPAETIFAGLVGLTLRPRRLREAAVVWDGLGATGDIAARDELWVHPDLLPDAAALDDPTAFVFDRGGDGADLVGEDPVAQIEALTAAQQHAPAGNDGGASDAQTAADPAGEGDPGGPHAPDGPDAPDDPTGPAGTTPA